MLLQKLKEREVQERLYSSFLGKQLYLQNKSKIRTGSDEPRESRSSFREPQRKPRHTKSLKAAHGCHGAELSVSFAVGEREREVTIG